MNVKYSEAVKEPIEIFRFVEEATRMLFEDVLGDSALLVSAEWDRDEDARGRQAYTLRISDFLDTVQGGFASDELQRPTHARARLHRLWGDLLQARSKRLLQELQKN